MNPVQLLAHFDRVADAPDAVPRLRRFILDLATRGKLVEQDPDDEPASDLLKRIQTEKARLVKEREIRRERPLPLVEEDEAPYSSPTGWEWVRIRQVTSDRGQMTPDKDFTYIDVTAINKEVGCVADAKVLSPLDAPSRARKMVRTGDVLYSCVRPYLLNIAVIERDIVPSPIASTAFAVLNGFGLVLSKYLWIALRSPFMVECVEAKMRGQAYPAINDSDFAILPLPLPPLAEQHRIVVKVDELMALCDRLAAAQAERESRRDRLAAASLHGLNNGGDDDIFRKHARFHLRHLPRLTTRAEHVKQLRQTILNVAVRGRLVSQNHNDEPAIDLLERIHAERARLVKDGKTRKQQPLTPMGSGTIPFDVPEKWIWARLPDLCHVITDGEHLTPEYSGSGIPILSAKHIGADQIIVDDYKLVSRGVAEKCWARCFPEERDILVVSRGAGVGRTIVSGRRDYCLMGSVLLFKPASLVNEHFLCTFLNSAIGNEKLRATSGASAQQAIYIAHLKRDYVVPLPPLAEQQRIVAKVDELMALCDRLEAQLTTTEFTRHQLLEATIHEAISGQVELQQSARR